MRPETELNDIIIRKSQLAHWKICPRLYESIWILNMPSQPGVEQQFGTMFHRFTAKFFSAVDYEKLQQCKTANETYDLFTSMLNSYPNVIWSWIDNFLRFEANRWEFIRGKAQDPLYWWKPVALELELQVPSIGLVHHVDRIDRVSTGTLINIEYKTDKWWYISKLRWELAFYNIGINASKHFDVPCTHIGAFNPQLNRWFSEICTIRLRNATYRLIRQFRRSIETGDFPPRPSQFCRYCVALQRCIDDGIFNNKEGE